MKKLYFFIALLSIMLSQNLSSQTIYSTSSGGDWNDTLTWVGWIIPASTNDVVINGTVHVSHSAYCNNITINNGAILQNNSYTSYELYTYGNLTNNGTIRNNPNGSSLNIRVGKNLVNNGTMQNWKTYFEPYSNWNHYFSSIGTIDCYEFEGSYHVYLLSDITITNTRTMLKRLHLEGFTFETSGDYIHDMEIYSDTISGGTWKMGNNAYMYNMDFYNDLVFDGTVNVAHNVEIHDNLTNNGVLQNHGWSSYTLSCEGDLVNNGTIQTNGYSFELSCFKSIQNNGTWSNNRILFYQGTHTISGNQPFNVGSVESTWANLEISALNDLTFIGTTIDLDDDSLKMNGHNLYLDGCLIRDIYYFPTGGQLNMINGSYAYSLNIMDSITIAGDFQFQGNIDFYGAVNNTGTIRNHSWSSYSLDFHHDIYNNGTISNGTGNISTIYAYKDIYNNGTWNNSKLELHGTDVQNIYSTSPFEVGYFRTYNSAGVVKLQNNTEFINSHVHLDGDDLDIQSNELKITGGYNSGGYHLLSSNGTLKMSNSAYWASYIYGDINFAGKVETKTLHVYGNVNVVDTLTNDEYSNYHCSIFGNLINNGIIQNNYNYKFYLHLEKDFINNGAVSNWEVILQGDSIQNLTFNMPVSPYSMYSNDTTGYLNAITDLTFEHTYIDLNQEELRLNGHTIELMGNYLIDGKIYSDNGIFNLQQGAYLDNLDIYQNVNLLGKVSVANSVSFYGTTTVTDTLTNRPDYNHNMEFFGDVINNGVITNNYSYYLYVDVYKSIENNGIWNNHDIEFRTNEHQITATQPFEVYSFVSPDTSGYFTINSDISFINSRIDLNHNELYLNGNTLSASGGQLLDEINIYSGGGTIHLENSRYMYQCNIYDSLNLTGRVQLHASNYFYGPVNVIDTLENDEYYNYECFFYSDLHNNGIIRNNPNGYVFYINCYDDVINNGEIQVQTMKLSGDSIQELSGFGLYSPDNLNSYDTTGYISLQNDIYFENTKLYWSYEDIFLNGNTLNISGNQCNDGIFYADEGSIKLNNGAYIYRNTFIDSITFTGNVLINSSNHCQSSLTIIDTLANYSYYTYDMTIDGDLYNFGLIRNGLSYSMSLYVKGNIYNAGQWTNSYTRLNGENNQQVYLEDLTSIGGYFGMYSNVPGENSYAWSLNGSSLIGETGNFFSGENSNYLQTTGPLSSTYFGVYNCSTNAGYSRNITVGPWTIPVIADAGSDTAICEGSSVILTANASEGQTPYSYLWSNGETTQTITVSPLTTTLYTVTISGSAGSSDNDDVSVIVNSNPVVDLGMDQEICEGEMAFFESYASGSYLWSDGSTYSFFETGIAGNYSLEVTDQNGCTGTDNANVIVNSLPVVDLGQDTSLCDGEIFILESNLSGTFIWSDGSSINQIPVYATGNYSLTFTDNNGCSNDDDVNVTFNPLPLVDLGADQNLPAGSVVLLDAGTGFSSYLWNNGETSQTINVSNSGNYSVTVSNAFDCSAFDDVNINIANPVNTPSWSFTNTGTMHTILVMDNIPKTIDGQSIVSGDYIGVFFDSLGTLYCAGYIEWMGQTITITAFGDDATTTEKDGFYSGENFVFKIWQASSNIEFIAEAEYMPYPSMPNQGEFAANGISGLVSLEANTIDTQSITIPSGWSFFSTYIDLFEPNMDSIFADVVSQVMIVKSGSGMTYWPQYNLNMIGNNQIGEAYQVKMLSTQTIVCEGNVVQPEITPINIPQGWSYLGYLRQTSGATEILLNSIINDIIIMKDSYGNIFWPEYFVNMMPNLYPGQGYQIKTYNAVQLYYPANSVSFKSIETKNLQTVHFPEIPASESNMTLGIPLDAWDIMPETGDEIAVVNSNNDLIAVSVFDNKFTAITIWGKDNYNPSNSGLGSGDQYFIKLWNKNQNSSKKLEINSFSQGDRFYNENDISVISQIKTLSSELNEIEIEIYPNPVSTILNISCTSHEQFINTEIYNNLGKLIMSKQIHSNNSNTIDTKLDLRELSAGSYFVKIYTNNEIISRKIELIK